MPRPNRTRSLDVEETLANRIAQEREHRGWTYEGLAKRMSDVGCAIQPSALYKIEKGRPRRRITVDELVGLSLAFGMTVPDLLLDPWAADDLRFRQVRATSEKAYRDHAHFLIAYTTDKHELARLCSDPDGGDARYRALLDELEAAENVAAERGMLEVQDDGLVDSITVNYLRDVVAAVEKARSEGSA